MVPPQPLATTTDGRPARASRGIRVALVLFACALYANTLGHGYVLDDNTVIRDNPQVEAGIAGIPSILASPFAFGANVNAGYRPLSVASFALEHSVFGDAPFARHLVNVLLYALTGLLLYRVLARLLADRNRLLPLAATLLYLAHPAHTEVVANLKSRDLLLCLLGCLGALGALLRYAQDGGRAWLAAGLGSFFLALLSRQSALPFVLVIPLALALFARTGRRRLVEVSAGLLATAGAYLALYVAVAGSLVPTGYRPSVSVVSNALASIPDLSDRLATTVYTWGFYLRLFVVPHPLSYDYSYAQIPTVGWSHPGVLASALAYLVLGFGALFGLRRHPVPAFGILFHLLTFSIVSNLLVQTGDVLAVRFLYIPSVGSCLLAAYVLLRLAGRAFPVALGAVLLVFSALTVARNTAWESDATLFTTDVRVSPNSAKANLGHGIALLNRSTEESGAEQAALRRQGIAALERALEIYPLYADVFTVLEVGYTMSGDAERAREALERRVAAHGELAERARARGETAAVEEHERRAGELQAELRTKYATAPAGSGPSSAGLEALRDGRYAEAVAAFETAYLLPGSDADAAYYLGLAHERNGDLETAARHYAEATRRDAAHVRAHNNLGIVYTRWNQLDAAIRSFERAVAADPGHAKALYNLGLLHAQKDDPARAEEYLRKSIAADPGYEKPYQALIKLKAGGGE